MRINTSHIHLLLSMIRFGAVESNEVLPNGDIVVHFATRKQAEKAHSHGGVFDGLPLVLDWYSHTQNEETTDQTQTGDNMNTIVAENEMQLLLSTNKTSEMSR